MRRSRGEWLAWAALAAVLLVPVWWGAHDSFPWDLDNLAPGSVLKGLAKGFGGGWYSSYGPLPYYLMGALYVPVLAVLKLAGELGRPAAAWPYGFRHPELEIGVLVVAARLATVACALGIAWVSARRARDDDPDAPRWLVPLLLLGSAQFAFYGRTSNADVHALFWLFLGVVLAETARGRLSRLCAAAAASVAALCCKEQAGPAGAVIGAACVLQALRLPGGTGARLRAAGTVVAAAAVTYAALWQLPFNAEGWRAHHEFLWQQALYPRKYPATPAGFAGLAAATAGYVPLALGLPVLAGLAFALVRRVPLRGLGLRTAVVAVYLAGFVGRIGYVYPRFVLPLLILALPLAVRGFAVPPRARPAVAALVVALGLAGGPLVSWLMLADPRLDAERWLRANAPAGAVIEVAGNAHGNVRLPHGAPFERASEAELLERPRGPAGDLVVLSSIDADHFRRDPRVREAWWEPLHAPPPEGRYRVVARFPRPFGSFAVGDMWLGPEITIYRREAGPGN